MGKIVILARYRVQFIIEHENLVLDLSNNKSIIAVFSLKLLLSQGFITSIGTIRMMKKGEFYRGGCRHPPTARS